MRTVVFLGVLAGGRAARASEEAPAVTAAWCEEQAAAVDQRYLAGDGPGAWAQAEALGERCAETGARPGKAAAALWKAATDEARPVEVRLPEAERELLLTLATRGPWAADLASSLNQVGDLRYRAGRAGEAVPLVERELAIRERISGPEHPDTATAAHNLAVVLADLGDLPRALPLQERALAIRQAALGPDHPDTAWSMSGLALLLQSMGSFDRALPLAEAVLEIRLRVAGPDHPDIAYALEVVAGLHQAMGDHDRALPLYEQALELRERVQGPEHPDTASALHQLAGLLRAMGEGERALPLCERALRIMEGTLGPDHPLTARTLESLARLHDDAWRFDAALPLYERALAIRERTRGPDHPDTADSLASLAGHLLSAGQAQRALTLFERALAIREQAQGPDHPATANALASLAAVHGERGAHGLALDLLERALAINEGALGPDHPFVAYTLVHLALVHLDLGAHGRALPLLQRALAIEERALGPDHPDTVGTRVHLAGASLAADQPAEALAQFTRALALVEGRRGPEHPDTVGPRVGQAEAHLFLGQAAAAIDLYEGALAIQERALGGEDIRTASTLSALALAWQESGEPERAVPLYLRAQAIRARTLGAGHHLTAQAELDLASALFVLGRHAEVVPLLRRALASQEAYLARNLWLGSAVDRAAFLQTRRTNLDAALTVHLRGLPRDPDAAALAAETLLRRKGRTQEVEGELLQSARARQDPATGALLDALAAASARLDGLSRQAPDDPALLPAWQAAMAVARQDLDDQARRLAQVSADWRSASTPVTLADVARRLPAHAALVEWLVWQPFEPGEAGADSWGAPRYAAYVVRPEGLVGWADLGEAAEIEARAQALRAAILAEEEVDPAARALAERVFAPLAPHLRGVEQLLLSPDGALHLVPLDLLAGPDGRPLAQTHTVTLVGSGRELLALDAEEGGAAGPPLVVAAVDFASEGADAATGPASSRSGDLRPGMRWAPLPGTLREGEEVAALLHGARLLTGASATEQALKAVASPRILHVATHGFFLGDLPAAAPAGRRGFDLVDEAPGPDLSGAMAESPLLRSGLVLAGANRASATHDIGYLTAQELVHLDLRGTSLVALSACETGVGEIRAGDGVQGLRRALSLAGADTQVLSLWKVDDEATAALMAAFYGYLAAGEARGEALRRAKVDIAATPGWAHPVYWAAFTLAGDWRALPG